MKEKATKLVAFYFLISCNLSYLKPYNHHKPIKTNHNENKGVNSSNESFK